MRDDRSVSIGNDQCVEIDVIFALKERDRQHNTQLSGQALHVFDDFRIVYGLGEFEVFLELVLAEIRCREQFLNQDNICSVCCRLADKRLGVAEVGVDVPSA